MRIAVRRLMGLLASPVLCCLPFVPLSTASDQDLPPSDPDTIPVVQLRVSSATEVKGISEQLLSNSVCAPDGNGFLTRLVGPTGEGDVRFISDGGKNVTRLSTDKIVDVNAPFVEGFFAGNSELYLLVIGSTPQNKTITMRKSNGETETQQAVSKRTYISHFSKDGSYGGSVALELPFTPMQFGVFQHGDFLIAGADKFTEEPRVALVKSTGQFDRFLELRGDVHAQSDPRKPDENDAAALPRRADNYMDTLQAAVGFSTIIPDGANLVLVRPGQRTPVFSVSPGGAVRPVTVDVPKSFSLFDLKAGRNEWIALYTRKLSADPKDGRLELEIDSLDPKTGKTMTKYAFPNNLGLALACANGATFTVLTREEDKLQLIIVSH